MGVVRKLRQLIVRRVEEPARTAQQLTRARSEEPDELRRALAELGFGPAPAVPTSPARGSPEELNLRISRLGPRVEATGDPAEREELIEAMESLLDARVLRPDDQRSLLGKLVWALDLRIQAEGRRSDLDRQVAAREEILELTPEGSANRVTANLATALKERHLRTGRTTDLDRAIDLYSGALEELAPDDPDRYVLLTNFGSALRMRHERTGSASDIERAVALCEESIRAAVGSGDPDTQAILRNNLANALADRAELTGSLADLDRALDQLQEAIDRTRRNDVLGARLHVNLARGLIERYDLTADPADVERALETVTLGGRGGALEPLHRMDGLNSIGARLLRRHVATGNLTDLEQAISAFEGALAEPVEAGTVRFQVLSNLSAALRDRADLLGESADAEDAVEAARAALEVDPDDAGTWTNLGNALRARAVARGDPGDLDEALRSYRRAFQLDETEALYANNLAAELRDRFFRGGRRQDLIESIELLERAIRSAPVSSLERPRALSNLGKALALLDPVEHRERIGSSYERAARDGLELATGVALEAASRWEAWAADEGDWLQAVEALTVAEEAAERVVRSQHLRGQKEAWLAKIQGLAARSAFARARAGDPAGAAAALERGLARLLAETLEQHRIELEALRRDHEASYQRFRTAAAQVARLEGRLLAPAPAESAESAESAAPRPPGVSLAAIRAARAELDGAIAEIRRLPGYENLFRPADAADLAAPLRGPAKVDAVVYLVVVPRGSAVLSVMDGEVEADLPDFDERELREALLDFEVAAPTDPTPAFARLLDVLGARLMDAVAARLVERSARSVALVPVGWLGNLPLHAARCPSLGAAVHFLDRFAVTLTPSARSLAFAQRSARREPSAAFFVGVGNPLPSDKPLAGAASEVVEVARRFRDRSRLLVGRAATRHAVLRDLARATHLHFACHGVFSPHRPLDSGLVLAGGRTLSLRDLLDGTARPETARLAVLSACDTAAREIGRLPDEAIGLPTGFLQAGVPGVIGSLWAVDDLSTALLMVCFYRIHLGDGEHPMEAVPPAEALAEAQRWLRGLSADELELFLADHPALADLPRPSAGATPFASPFHWAPFAWWGA